MITLEARHKAIVDKILERYPYTFYVYGSRAKGTAKKFSDLDLCVMEDISLRELSHLEEEFEESDLPFTVDIIVWPRCSESFRAYIQDDLVLWK